MTRRERAVAITATVLSVSFHAAVLYYVAGLHLGAGSTRLFASIPSPHETRIGIYRDPKDLYIEDRTLEELLNLHETADSPTQVRKAAEDLIRKLETELVSEELEGDPAELATPEAPAVEVEAPLIEVAEPSQAGAIDSTAHLLALAQPAVELPQFRPLRDEPVTRLPDELPPLSGLGGDGLEGLIGGGTGASGGEGRGGAAALADASDVGRPGAGDRQAGEPPTPPPTIARVDPEPVIPDLPGPLIVPPLVTDEGRTIHLDEDFSYSLFTYSPPPRRGGFFGFGEEQETGPDYFEVRIEPRHSLRRLPPLNKDVVWAIDLSPAIAPRWIEPVKEGVASALEWLNDGDRFNIIVFRNQIAVFSTEGLVEANETNIAAAREFIAQIKPTPSGDINLQWLSWPQESIRIIRDERQAAAAQAEVNRVLNRLLVRTVPPDRVYQILLLSNGAPARGAVDPRAVINLITRENDRLSSIYAVAIGDRVDREALQQLSYTNKGRVVYPASAAQAAATINDLAVRLRYPLVKDLRFAAAGVERQSIYPPTPRDIYQNEPISLFGRFGTDAQRLSMNLTGLSGADRLDFTFTLGFPDARGGTDQIMHNWAFWKLHHFYGEVQRRGASPELQKAIEDLKKSYPRMRVDY